MKSIKITPPEGYEIDRENSTFEEIVFKPVRLTYGAICKELFKDVIHYCTSDGQIGRIVFTKGYEEQPNNAAASTQVRKMLALNQLLNISTFYNKKAEKQEDELYSLCYFADRDKYGTVSTSTTFSLGINVTFFREEDAEEVIHNPNFKTILDTVYK